MLFVKLFTIQIFCTIVKNFDLWSKTLFKNDAQSQLRKNSFQRKKGFNLELSLLFFISAKFIK